MINFQESNEGFKKKILPIKTVEQLAASYLVAQIVVEIRNELETEMEEKALESLPKLEGPVPQELVDLYIEAAKIMKYKPQLVFIMKYSIEDMINYSFSEDPSVVTAATNDTAHLQQMFGQSFSNLAKVNLLQHTINVFEEAVKKAKSKGRASGIVIPMIGALLHDFGKSTGIRDEIIGEAGSRGYKAHSEVSASYVREILSVKLYNRFNEIPADTIELLSNMVKGHHPANNKTKSDPAIAFIIEADHAARKKEYKEILQSRANS